MTVVRYRSPPHRNRHEYRSPFFCLERSESAGVQEVMATRSHLVKKIHPIRSIRSIRLNPFNNRGYAVQAVSRTSRTSGTLIFTCAAIACENVAGETEQSGHPPSMPTSSKPDSAENWTSSSRQCSILSSGSSSERTTEMFSSTACFDLDCRSGILIPSR